MVTIDVEQRDVKASDRLEVFDRLMDAAGEIMCGGLKRLLNAELDAEVTGGLGRGWRELREQSGERDAPWSCHRCGNQKAKAMGRDGHYSRSLQTLSGGLVGVQVPMLECQVCGASVDIEFAALPKHKHLWLDVDEEILFSYGADEALRHIAERVGKQLGWPVSPSSVQRRVHALAGALEQWRGRRWEVVPDVLMIDGIWFTLMEPTEERYMDRSGRQRARHRKVKRVAIVVLGLWSQTGEKEILDFTISAGEDEDTVLELLNGLHLRGITEEHVKLITSDGAGGIIAAIETAYPTVARQRCVFHKLKNVGDNLRDTTHRKETLNAAASIYEATTQQEAERRLEQFAAAWELKEPVAVASLRIDFRASLAYLRPLGIEQPQRFRTTNALEGGVQRRLRIKLDKATAFHSPFGAEAALFLAAVRINTHERGAPWVYEAHQLIKTIPCRNP